MTEQIQENLQQTQLWSKVLILLVLLLVLAVGIYKYLNSTKACQTDALICPDGSSISRVGPNCDFPPCPKISIFPTLAVDETANWKTYSDEYLSFNYPPDWEVGVPEVFGSHSTVEFKYNLTPLFILSKRGNYNQLTGKPYLSLDESLGERQKKYAVDSKAGTYPAKRITDPGDEGHALPSEEVLLFTPDKSFIVSLYYMKDYYDQPKSGEIFDQILSTFKFLD